MFLKTLKVEGWTMRQIDKMGDLFFFLGDGANEVQCFSDPLFLRRNMN